MRTMCLLLISVVICLSSLNGFILCRSVGPESVLWQNGLLHPDAISDNEWDVSRIGVLDGWLSLKGKGQFWG